MPAAIALLGANLEARFEELAHMRCLADEALEDKGDFLATLRRGVVHKPEEEGEKEELCV